MKSIIKLAFILTSISCINGMESNENINKSGSSKWSHNTYKGLPITSENIYELSPKPDTKLQEEIDSFFNVPDNKALIKMLNIFNPCKNVEELKAAWEKQKKFMEEHDIKNLSDFNYVFNVKDKNGNFHNFVIKIAGPLNIIITRISTVLDTDPYAKKVSEIDIEKVTREKVEIYQTVSSMAHYLRLFEIAKNFKYLKVAPTYLFPISDTKEKSCHDQNCIVIQELIKDENDVVVLHKLSPEEIKEILNNIPERAIKEIYLAIKHAALWNFWSNLMVNKKDKQTLWMSDLEQPNNANAKYFFFKEGKADTNWLKATTGIEQYKGNANCGLQDMEKVLKDLAPKQYRVWQELTKLNWEEFFEEMTKNKNE